MKIIEKDGKKYLVVQEEAEEVLWEIVQDLGSGKFRVRLPRGGEIVVTMGEEEEEEELQDYEDYGVPSLPERREAILQYLFEKKEPVPLKEIVNTVAPKFDVSKDTIYLDLEALIKEHLVEKVSRGLYKISKSGMSYFGVRPPGLYYECVESNLLKAIKFVMKAEKEGKVPEDLYITLVDALDCLRDLGRIYEKEWDIEVPLD